MPRAPETILQAGLSYRAGWGNQLTAIFAAVLAEHHRLAESLFELLELPTGVRFEAYTEVRARSTFVLGDSIDATGHGNHPVLAPVPVDHPDLLAAAVDRNVAMAVTMGEACCCGGYGYAEVHV